MSKRSQSKNLVQHKGIICKYIFGQMKYHQMYATTACVHLSGLVQAPLSKYVALYSRYSVHVTGDRADDCGQSMVISPRPLAGHRSMRSKSDGVVCSQLRDAPQSWSVRSTVCASNHQRLWRVHRGSGAPDPGLWRPFMLIWFTMLPTYDVGLYTSVHNPRKIDCDERASWYVSENRVSHHRYKLMYSLYVKRYNHYHRYFFRMELY